jgi:predicted RNA-binding Zn-ribbon protein involved in translation (DUF1610 family)
MAVIRASCPDCGDVELTTDDVQVRVCSADNQGSYHFRCPTCAMTVVKSAEPRTIDLLTTSGVSCATWDPPLELFEPRPDGECFTHDDLIDFHALLGDDDRLHHELDSLAGR